jgi:hypothetical protein
MLPEEDWLARRKIYRQVSKYLKDHDKEETWFPILYTWEVREITIYSIGVGLSSALTTYTTDPALRCRQ